MTSLGVAKASVTKAVTAADQFLQEHSQYLMSKLQFPQDNEEEVRMMVHVQESKLNTCIDRTESHLKTIEEKYSKLEELADDQDTIAEYFEKVEEIRGRLESSRMEFKAKLHLVLAQKDITYRAITARVNNGEPSDAHSASLERLMTTVVQQLRGGQKHQLPVIQLPQFSGDPWDFKKFWFGFEQLVHDNFDLTDYEKLTYLRSCLREDALRLVNTVPDDEYTYERTVSILKGKYDDKLAVAHQLHKKIRTLRTLDNSSSSARDLLERLQQLVPRLTDYGDAIDNRSFLTDLLRKFPDRVRTKTLEKIVDSSDDHPWTWKTISRLLERVIERNELLEAEREVFQSERPEVPRTRLPPQRTNRRHADESSPLCFLCEKGPHPPEQCRSTPFMDRRSVMQNKGLCFRCGVSHDYRSCQQRCPNCNRPHHVALCRENHSETTDNNDRNNTQRPQEGSNNRRGSDRRVENNTRETNQRNQNSRWNTGQNNRNSGGNRTDQPWRNSRDAPRSNATAQNNSSKPNPTKKETVNVTTENVNLVTPQAPFTAPIQKARNSPSGAVILTGMVPIMKQNHAPVPARALFDSGASISFIDSALVKELNLPIVEQRLISLQTFGQKSVERMYAITHFAVLDLEGKVYEVQAVCVPGTFFSTTVIPALSPADQAIIAHHGVTVADPNPDRREEPFRLLFDCDLMWNFVCRQSQSSLELPSGLKLIPSVFGYLRTGRTKETTGDHVHTILEVNNPGELSEAEQYWMTETLGTDEFSEQYLNENIHRQNVNADVQKEFEASTRRIDGRYYISFPQRSERIDQLSRNEKMSYKRLCYMYDTYKDNQWLLEKIQSNFDDQMERGMIERIDNDEISSLHPTFYAPFHPVMSMDKESTKVRVVFDASAHEKGRLSLNEVLHQGPNNLPQLTGILLRCRTSPILISADVEKAFLMIKLNSLDKDLTRFILPIDWSRPPSPDNIAHFRHTVLPFGINCSPYLLGAVLRLHLDQGYGGAAREDLLHQMYVDNVFMGAESPSDAQEKMASSVNFFADMKMNLRQFMTNMPAILHTLPPEKLSANEKPKILGIPWNMKSDSLSITVNYDHTASLTRRILSRQIASVYDPLGLAAPVTLKAKLFLQQLFQNKSQKWDQILTEEQHVEWGRIVDEVQNTVVSVPRYLCTKPSSTSTAVIFTDASTTAYGACIYLITEGHAQLIMSRTKLAPLRTRATVPKLELLALTLGFRLALHVLPELAKSRHLKLGRRVYVLSDSTAALGWLKMDKDSLHSKKLGVLVYNRIKEIHHIVETLRATNRFFAQHVSTEQNPADHCSRGLTRDQLVPSKWLTGPDFLHDRIFAWPEAQDRFEVSTLMSFVRNQSSEPRQPYMESLDEVILTIGTSNTKEEDRCIRWTDGVNMPVTNEQPTRLTRLYKAGALVARFFQKCLRNQPDLRTRLVQNIPEIDKVSTENVLTATDVTLGRNLIVRLQQHEAFSHLSPEQLHKSYAAEKDEHGVLRLHGRLGKSKLPLETQKPILVSGKHPLAELIIEHFHVKSMHYGTAHTLAALRSQYWITKPRARINQVLANCRHCRLMNRRPFGYPNAPDLPTRRLQATRPFQHVGLDYFGPLLTRETKDAEPQKRWILLITCLTTRAIYLDLVNDLSTQAFLSALRRFFALYGIPESVTSDNAPQFHLGERILNLILSSTGNTANQVQRFMAEQEIQWYFISAFAPWQGGVYERLCGSVKAALFKVLRRKRPTFDELRTVLDEIAAALNKRPLTYVDNSDDWSLITPSHFLAQGVRLVIPRVVLNADDEEYLPPSEAAAMKTQKEALNALAYSQDLSKQIWDEFESNYLTSLAEVNRIRRKHHHHPRAPVVGEIVMVKDALRPRYAWPLAKVIEPMKGSDGHFRNVRLMTASGKEITRPVSLLIPMELSSEIDSSPHCLAPADHQVYRRYNLRARKNPNDNDAVVPPVSDMGEEDDDHANEMVHQVVLSTSGNHTTNSCYPLFADDSPHATRRSQEVVSVHCIHVVSDTVSQIRKGDGPYWNYSWDDTGIDLRKVHFQQYQDTWQMNTKRIAEVPLRPVLLPVDKLRNTSCTPSSGVHPGHIDNSVNRFSGEPRRMGGSRRLTSLRTATMLTFLCLMGTLLPTCNAQTFSCAPGGLAFNMTERQDVTVCSRDFCVETTADASFVMLPPSYVVSSHEITVKYRANNRIHVEELQCPAVENFCDHIQCTFCTDNLANPECHPKSVAATVIVTVYILLAAFIAVCTTSCRPASVVAAIFRLILWPLILIYRLIKKIRRAHRGRNRRRSAQAGLVLLRLAAISSLLTSVVHACDHIEMMEQDVTRCTPEGTCATTHLQSIWLAPTNPVGCIQATVNKTVMFSANIAWKKTSLKCSKVTDTYTRSVHHFVASSKRCARTGSCIPEFCGNVLPNTTIEELGRHNDAPGKTYCTESTGFITGGCFFPSAGCLFWRETLVPDDDIVYEVFHCPSWTEHVSIELTLMENGNTQTFVLPLVPGRQKTVNGHRITVTNIERAVYPILNSHFISDGNYTAVLENSEEIHLWCSDRETAQKGRCQAEPNCKCQPAETTMHCECNPTRLTTVFENPKRVLPVHHTNIVLREQVVAELEASGSVLVEWNITAQKSVIHEEKNPCTMELSQLEGCYACREGSRTHATCSSSRPFTAALTCGDQVYAVDCAPGGKQSELHYFSNYASVDVHCETHCDPTVLALQGTLRYHSPVRGLIQAASWTANDREITLPDVSHLISSVAEYIGIRVIILMIVGTIIGGLYLYLRGQTWFLTPRLLAQQQKSHQL